MKVGFVFPHPFSESVASVARISELASSLEKLGSEAFFLTLHERSFDLFRNAHVVSIGSFISNSQLSKSCIMLTSCLTVLSALLD